jgi:hypothetical protein
VVFQDKLAELSHEKNVLVSILMRQYSEQVLHSPILHNLAHILAVQCDTHQVSSRPFITTDTNTHVKEEC